MNLTRGLRLDCRSRIAFTGAGGKTTAMFQIARQLLPPVWVTTSTHLGIDQLGLADTQIEFSGKWDELKPARQPKSGVTVFTSTQGDSRAAGLAEQELEMLKQAADEAGVPLLVEADGSRTLPLKAPAIHEPVIPGWVDLVVVTAGLSGIGKLLDEAFVHRPEVFARLSGLQIGEVITLEALLRVLLHPEGGLKGIPPTARRIALLNQADCMENIQPVISMAQKLLVQYDAALVASLASPAGPENAVQAVIEPCAGIVLAGGESRRLQRPKQLLEWRGEPLVRRVTKTALAAGCNPVVVVTGAHAAEVEATLVGLPVKVSHNSEWTEGQASSIRSGVAALPERTGSAFFFLCDQPQIPPELSRKLIEAHSHSLSPIIAPRSGGVRVNPVLFDRVTFPELLLLSGDTGGRSLFERYPVEYLDWEDPLLQLDVDTPEDYLKLLDYE